MGDRVWQIVSGLLGFGLLLMVAWVGMGFDGTVDERIDLKLKGVNDKLTALETGQGAIEVTQGAILATQLSEAGFNEEFRENVRTYINRGQ